MAFFSYHLPPKKCGTHVTPISIFFWLSIPNSIIARHDNLTIIGTWSSMLARADAGVKMPREMGPGPLGWKKKRKKPWSYGSTSINGRTCIWIYMGSWGYNRTYNYKAYNPLCNWLLWAHFVEISKCRSWVMGQYPSLNIHGNTSGG